MNKQFLVVDASGFVVAHLGAKDRFFDGLHFASIQGLPAECRAAIHELLSESGATERQEGRARRTVKASDHETEIRLIEAIRIERVGCDLRRALGDLLFSLSNEAREAGAQLTMKMAREIPERVVVDADKFIWITTSLIRNALFSVRRRKLLRPGGSVEVDLNYDTSRNLVSVTIEYSGQGRRESDVAETSLNETLGQFTGAGKFVRSIVDAHGGILIWESIPAGDRMGTRVSFTIPAL
ncbi:MAG: hypothetical protein ACXVBE_04565 [Bdellovibrionota bacterium]